jgi:hypothetical protein
MRIVSCNVKDKAMKITLLTFLLSLTFARGLSQDKTEFKFLAKPDSIIERRLDGYIYITSDTNSRVYNYIVPNPEDKWVKNVYSGYIDDIQKKYKQNITQFPVGNFPRRWNSVYTFKGNYFLYGPSDWMANSGFYISDSVIYITSSDPYDIYLVTGYRPESAENVSFTVLNYLGETKHINIKVIDRNLGIYEWTIRDKTKHNRKFLMQNSDFSKKLKMIVCDCGNIKCIMEFRFDNKK